MKKNLLSFRWSILSLIIALLFVLSSQAAIVINEIHFDPDVKMERAEFIELHNTGNATVSLAGWQLRGAVAYIFPAGTSISAGGFLVIAESPATIASKYKASALGPWTGILSNEGEEIELVNAAGGREDAVDYNLGFPWPTVGEPPGYSIELINPVLDNNLGGHWRASFSGTSAGYSYVALPERSTWMYFEGTAEPSSPATAWRSRTFADASWPSGRAPVGYDPGVPMGTTLSLMRSNYTTVFFRNTFVITNVNAVTAVRLDALFDDGFKVWINGQPIRDGAFNMAAGELAYTATAASALEDATYRSFDLGSPQSFLVQGTNVIAVQAANSHLWNSSDFYFDARLNVTIGPRVTGPTPGLANSVFSANAPPAIRQVENKAQSPTRELYPRSGTPVKITAKVTDPDGVKAVTLDYQVVEPGAYVSLTNTAYAQGWTTLTMNDSGTGGDELAGDSTYTVTLPGAVQQHRRLIRYRISVADNLNASVRVPYADDPVPNFAYFCYDGVPAHQAAVNPGATPVLNFDTNAMGRLPAVHLLASRTDVESATWFSRYGGDAYPWAGTLVYDGEVYDHVHFRARGGVWRYAMVKNMWKFDMNRGHSLQMRDDYGRKYKTKWRKLNLGASIQQGDYQHRGEQGMFESVGFKLFNMAGVESPKTTFLQLRIVDQATEADPSSQYEGDFWGVYLGIEQEDGRFLEEHGMPDGNLYKMEGGTGELNNIAPAGPLDKSDLNAFLNTYRNSTTPASESWWRTNLNLSQYFSYQAIVQAIHHYDICYDKNYFYFRDPATGRWSVHSWDLDLTWADNMFASGCGGIDDLYYPVLGGGGYPAKERFTIEYKNRVREIADLLYNTDQAWKVIDEYAQRLRGPANTLSILEADRCQWDYNPKMANSAYSSSLNKAGQGRFYQWPLEPSVSKDFNGCIQLMKDYVVTRGGHLANITYDPQIPAQPNLNYAGPLNYPLNEIRLRCSAFSGVYGFASMKWRIGEVSHPGLPSYDPTAPQVYEIASVWETPELTSYNSDIFVPAGVLKPGHTYRARVQFKDVTGRQSHWSAPVEFTTSLPANAALLAQHLKITELMYDPPEGSAREFVELFNSSTNVALDLAGVKFTAGIDYTFDAGTTLAPQSYALVIRDTNFTDFRAFYSVPQNVLVAGPYSGSLNNGGEEVTLKTSAAGLAIASFEYGSGRLWPAETQAAGHSLIPLTGTFDGQATGALDYPLNWQASSFIKGSPGRVDPPRPASPLRLNEIVAHTDYTNPSRPEYDSNDWIELVNTSGTEAVLQNLFLSDDPAQPRKWAVPNTTIPPNGRRVYDEVTGFHSPITSGFGLDKAGEQVLLSYLPGTAEDRVIDSVRFKGQENGASLSRYPDGAPWWFRTAISSNAPNTAGLSSLVISEVMYRPPMVGTNDDTTHEFIEIWNPTGSPVTLQDTNGSWRLDGGISFTFPAGVVLNPRSVLLVVSFDPANIAAVAGFKSYYAITASDLRLFGPYSGKLGNRSDRVALEKGQYPDVVGASYSWIVLDEVTYGNQVPWPGQANGGGHSLQRTSISEAGDNPASWAAGNPTPGAAEIANADSDGDGMPDAWESAHGLDPNNADATADPDGDGLSNYNEYLCGTDPTDPESYLGIQSATVQNGIAALTFRAMAGKTYSVQVSGTLDPGTWSKVADVPAGDERTVSVSDYGSEGFSLRYYRLVTPAVP